MNHFEVQFDTPAPEQKAPLFTAGRHVPFTGAEDLRPQKQLLSPETCCQEMVRLHEVHFTERYLKLFLFP